MSDADLIAIFNDYQNHLIAKVLAVMDGLEFQGDTATQNLTVNTREYSFPIGLLKIKRVDAKLDDVNWTRVEPFDPGEVSYPLSSESDIVNHFTNANPFYHAYDNYIFIYSGTISTVSSGLNIWFEKAATDLSADTDEPAIAAPFHSMLSEQAALLYFTKNNVTDRVKEFIQKLMLRESDLLRFYGDRQEDEGLKFITLNNIQDYK